jgi:hypothetical protein
MLVDTSEWSFQGSGGRVAIRLRPPAHRVGARGGELTADVTAELRSCGSLRGSCTVGLTTEQLKRFHRELDGLLAGREPRATLGSLGDQFGLTIDTGHGGAARLSGFLGTGLTGAVSFNDLELDEPALRRSNVVLADVVRDLLRRPSWTARAAGGA